MTLKSVQTAPGKPASIVKPLPISEETAAQMAEELATPDNPLLVYARTSVFAARRDDQEMRESLRTLGAEEAAKLAREWLNVWINATAHARIARANAGRLLLLLEELDEAGEFDGASEETAGTVLRLVSECYDLVGGDAA